MCVAGIAGGVAYAAVPAFLKTRFGVNEILTSLMLTYVATLFLSTLVYVPLNDPLGFNFPPSLMFGDAALLPVILYVTRLHSVSFFSLSFAVAVCVLMCFSIFVFPFLFLFLSPSSPLS